MNDEPVKPKVKRLDFGKKNPINQAEEDAIDASIAPLAPSTLTSSYADDDKGEFLEPADQAEGMDMTEVPTEVAETGTLDEITATDDAAREAAAAAEDAEESETIADLEAKELDIKAQIEARKQAEKQHVCGEIVKVMSQFTVDIDYLAAFMGVKYKRKGSKAKPKYRDPMTGKTWSGRGKTPVWIRGKDFSKFLI